MSDFDFDTPTIRRRGKKTAEQDAASTAGVEDKSAEDTLKGSDASGKDEEGKAKPKYDPTELAAIFDEIIFSGEYTEQLTIRGKLRVTFRTRTSQEVRDITRLVDGTSATYATTLEQARSLLHLQYALVMYNDRDLRSAEVDGRAKFIGNLPGPVVAALLTALSKFDEKVFAACEDAEENF